MKNAPKLHFVTGKGGVGKTSVACALALSYAQRGKRVLLAEINGGDRVAQAFGTDPVGYNLREVQPNLWAIDLSPEASLREYVLLTIKVQAIYRAIFEGRVVSGFLRLLPALGELTMLGKVWYEWVATDKRGRPRYDVIVLDAPATGHARALLLAAQAVKDSVPSGGMRDNAERIDTMLHHANSQIDIVTTAEDMPVSEAEELLSFVRAHHFARCSLVENQVPKLMATQATSLLAQLEAEPGPLQPVGRTLLLRNKRAERGHAALQRLQRVADTTARVPSFAHGLPSLELLQKMGAQLQGSVVPTPVEATT